MNSLDDIDLDKHDPGRIASQIRELPNDCRKAWQEAEKIAIPDEYSSVNNIVLVGMGGSGAANEVIKEIAYQSRFVIETVHDYTLPGYVDQNSLVIISSYSGTTEEVIAAYGDAKRANAKIFVITTGGEIEALSKEDGIPSYVFSYPSQPRMAMPYLLTPLISIFVSIGAYKLPVEFNEICNEVENTLQGFFPETNEADNLAKQLARRLYKKVPIIYASTLLRGIAMRFKNQINENSKGLAFYDIFPELNHNTIEGYVNKNADIFVTLLQSNFENERIKLRQNITAEIMEKADIPYSLINFNSCSNEISEHLVFASFSDAVSFYLALLYEVDPTAIPNIKFLKSKL